MPDKSFPIGLVGESHYQGAIAGLCEGDPVDLVPEPDNPHDPRAISAETRGATIGYLPRDSWLTEAILDENRLVEAEVASIRTGASGDSGVVLTATLIDKRQRRAAQRAAEAGAAAVRRPAPASSKKGWIVGGLVLLGIAIAGSGAEEEIPAASGGGDGPKAAATAPAAPDPFDAEAADALDEAIWTAAAPCEQAGKDVAAAIADAGGRYPVYRAATVMQSSCGQAEADVRAIETKGTAVREACADALMARKLGAWKLAEAFDEGLRPSAMADAEALLARGASGLVDCADDLATARSAAG